LFSFTFILKRFPNVGDIIIGGVKTNSCSVWFRTCQIFPQAQMPDV